MRRQPHVVNAKFVRWDVVRRLLTRGVFFSSLIMSQSTLHLVHHLAPKMSSKSNTIGNIGDEVPLRRLLLLRVGNSPGRVLYPSPTPAPKLGCVLYFSPAWLVCVLDCPPRRPPGAAGATERTAWKESRSARGLFTASAVVDQPPPFPDATLARCESAPES